MKLTSPHPIGPGSTKMFLGASCDEPSYDTSALRPNPAEKHNFFNFDFLGLTICQWCWSPRVNLPN